MEKKIFNDKIIVPKDLTEMQYNVEKSVKTLNKQLLQRQCILEGLKVRKKRAPIIDPIYLKTLTENHIIDGLEVKPNPDNPKQLIMSFGLIWDSKNKRIITLDSSNKNIKLYDTSDITFDNINYRFKMEYISDLHLNRYFIIYYRISDNTFYYIYMNSTKVEKYYKYTSGPNKGQYFNSIDFIKEVQKKGPYIHYFFGDALDPTIRADPNDFVTLVFARGTKGTSDNVKAKPLDIFLTPRFEDEDFSKAEWGTYDNILEVSKGKAVDTDGNIILINSNKTIDLIENIKENYIIDGLEVTVDPDNSKQLIISFGKIWDNKNKKEITLDYSKNIKEAYDLIEIRPNGIYFKLNYSSHYIPYKSILMYYSISKNEIFAFNYNKNDNLSGYKYTSGPNKGQYMNSIDHIKEAQKWGSSANNFFGHKTDPTKRADPNDFVILAYAIGTFGTPDNVKAKPLDIFLTPRYYKNSLIVLRSGITYEDESGNKCTNDIINAKTYYNEKKKYDILSVDEYIPSTDILLAEVDKNFNIDICNRNKTFLISNKQYGKIYEQIDNLEKNYITKINSVYDNYKSVVTNIEKSKLDATTLLNKKNCIFDGLAYYIHKNGGDNNIQSVTIRLPKIWDYRNKKIIDLGKEMELDRLKKVGASWLYILKKHTFRISSISSKDTLTNVIVVGTHSRINGEQITIFYRISTNTICENVTNIKDNKKSVETNTFIKEMQKKGNQFYYFYGNTVSPDDFVILGTFTGTDGNAITTRLNKYDSPVISYYGFNNIFE